MGLARLRLDEIRLRLLHSSFGWWVPREKSLAVSLVKHVAKLVQSSFRNRCFLHQVSRLFLFGISTV